MGSRHFKFHDGGRLVRNCKDPEEYTSELIVLKENSVCSKIGLADTLLAFMEAATMSHIGFLC